MTTIEQMICAAMWKCVPRKGKVIQAWLTK